MLMLGKYFLITPGVILQAFFLEFLFPLFFLQC